MNYKRIYESIIHNATRRTLTGYTEKHHIVPVSSGGIDDESNLVELTAREHFICHWLLSKFTKGKDKAKMVYALRMMKMENPHQQRYDTKITARVYENLKVEYAKVLSETFRGRSYPGELNGMYGKNHNKKSKQLMSKNRKGKTAGKKNGMYGKTHTQEAKDKVSIANKGNTAWNKGVDRSEEDKQKMKEGWAKKVEKGFNPHNKGKKYPKKKCPHCGTIGAGSIMGRWHFDNCREK